jgi:hypothetical protein
MRVFARREQPRLSSQLTLDGDLAKAERKTLRYRIFTPQPGSYAADGAGG